jgi:histone deacetylase 1/2
VRLPFSSSHKIAHRAFELLHCDLWTSPVISNSGYKYYLVILDDHTHYAWTFPLRAKSEVLPTLICFHAYARTQFSSSIACLQTDNGKEFDNHALRSFLSSNGMILRLTCPYTSQQNGRAERVLRTLNDSIRALLFHAAVPATFWPEALATATYTLNRRPCRPRHNDTPYKLLYGHHPSYDHLRVFGCLCYPNLTATAAHKLAPRSVACIFLGYPPDTKGYRCYDPETNKVIVSRHVYFDEHVFPFRNRCTPASPPASTTSDELFLPAPVRTTAPRHSAPRLAPLPRPAQAPTATPPPRSAPQTGANVPSTPPATTTTPSTPASSSTPAEHASSSPPPQQATPMTPLHDATPTSSSTHAASSMLQSPPHPEPSSDVSAPTTSTPTSTPPSADPPPSPTPTRQHQRHSTLTPKIGTGGN